MKKRLFAIMLALAMLLAAVPALAEEGGEALETAAKKICKACKKERDQKRYQDKREQILNQKKEYYAKKRNGASVINKT